MEKENRIEVFAYDEWNLCDKCERLFFDMVESFFQPERSKREDLDCCKRVEDLDDLLDDFHIEFCDGEDPYKSMNHYNKSCELLMKLIQESKMRCSEHCSNAVREVQKASSPKEVNAMGCTVWDCVKCASGCQKYYLHSLGQ